MIEIPEEVMSCNFDNDWRLWVHDWVDKRKLKGVCLSRATKHLFDMDYETHDIVRSQTIHGWVISVAGAADGCGWDTTMYFQIEEPLVVDGRWDGAITYDEDGEEIEHGAEVVDGPHKATWLEVMPST